MKFTQTAVFEPHNAELWIDNFESDEPITLDRVVAYYEKECDADWECDTVTLVVSPNPVKL